MKWPAWESIRFLSHNPVQGSFLLLRRVVIMLPWFRAMREAEGTQAPIPFSMWFAQKICRFNGNAYWPMHFTSMVTCPENIYAGVETCPGYMPGCYIQGIAKIYVGDYTQIGPGVGLISANHNVHDTRAHVKAKPIRIGKYCWIGMNCMILPEVELGDFTIVGAGAVVTKSFPEGHCLLVGNPAKVIKHLDKSKCVPYHSDIEYNGYIPAARFEEFRKRKLNV